LTHSADTIGANRGDPLRGRLLMGSCGVALGAAVAGADRAAVVDERAHVISC
jgi:hypothetical protein